MQLNPYFGTFHLVCLKFLAVDVHRIYWTMMCFMKTCVIIKTNTVHDGGNQFLCAISTFIVWETGKVHTGFWCRDLRERDYLEDLGMDGRIILNWVLKK